MRITFLIRSLAVGGAERQLRNLAGGLLRLGHTVSVLTLYEHESFESDLINAGIVVRSLGKRARAGVLLVPFIDSSQSSEASGPTSFTDT